MKNQVFIIAEAGVNHNGNLDMAFKLVDSAVKAGADAVKFQTFVADSLVSKTAKKAKYQAEVTDAAESQHGMLKRLELTQDQFAELQKYSKSKGIDFLSTAFDRESLKFLHQKLHLSTLKIASGELTNAPFILEHARTGCDLIISTGMADVDDIKNALSIVAFGYISKEDGKIPRMSDFHTAYSSPDGQRLLLEKVTLLHCTTEYPTPLEKVNLNAMNGMRDLFGLRVGYSDHTKGITVPIAAAALGAEIIEKHFTLDCSMEGPDHRASLEPDELKSMVAAIRAIEIVLGSSEKKITASELVNRDAARKSIIALEDINKGDLYSESNIGIMRPGTGLSPFRFWDTLGCTAKKTIQAGDIVE